MGTGRKKGGQQKNRSYPKFWEHAVPILVALIGIIIVGLLIIASLVAIGFISG